HRADPLSGHPLTARSGESALRRRSHFSLDSHHHIIRNRIYIHIQIGRPPDGPSSRRAGTGQCAPSLRQPPEAHPKCPSRRFLGRPFASSRGLASCPCWRSQLSGSSRRCILKQPRPPLPSERRGCSGGSASAWPSCPANRANPSKSTSTTTAAASLSATS